MRESKTFSAIYIPAQCGNSLWQKSMVECYFRRIYRSCGLDCVNLMNAVYLIRAADDGCFII